MKFEKKDILIGVLLVIIMVLILVIGLVYNNKENSKAVDNTNDQNYQNNNSVVDDTMEYNEDDFIRQTKVTLIEEPNCTGVDGGTLVAEIQSNGNISISQSGGAILVTSSNAKYLYRVAKLACDAVDLYYITGDNDLYVVDTKQLTSGTDQVATKATNSKVVEFLGIEAKEVEDGYNHYLKVLLQNGEVEYIKYLTTVK